MLAAGVGNKLIIVDPIKNPIKASVVGAGVGAIVSVGTDAIKPAVVNVVDSGIEAAKNKVQKVINDRGT